MRALGPGKGFTSPFAEVRLAVEDDRFSWICADGHHHCYHGITPKASYRFMRRYGAVISRANEYLGDLGAELRNGRVRLR